MLSSTVLGAFVMKNERGFMLLSAILLTLVVSIMATVFLRANVRNQQRNSALYYTAINLADEQFAILKSNHKKEIPDDDRKTHNGLKENAAPIEFRVTHTSGGSNVTVRVEWTVDGETKFLESTRTILAEN